MKDVGYDPEVDLVLTGDGSHTLKLRNSDAYYASTYGALEESAFVFIQNGLEEYQGAKEVNVLEVGFGTGANALLSALWAAKNQVRVRYTCLEPYPVHEAIWRALNYPTLIGSNSKAIFQQIHSCEWEAEVGVNEHFRIKKLKRSVLSLSAQDQFDLVYFDAFGPATQPALWDLSVLEKIHTACSRGATFVTYCAKGQVRRDLSSLGFNVERRPGPPGKRHILWAKKP